ncbi:D-alanine--D-alanine ligase family protein [Paractinoplanes atraurantiacus]|uniref:D-alanine--D-alanine ligase n=1 Tax=Paractinoplanes atraurantiacus TaxID=1036182 RepID=A0A285JM04_9ACTN|nr:D-alanine--D-alanine ligase [Actinoplanes atraurantiacus]SNY61103.1 D-alanine-D-alanine ligase [Actinoplanes atraurantiacus]
MSRLRAAVIGGGRNGEHQVSLASAASVAAALDPEGYEVVRLTIAPDGTWRDDAEAPIGLPAAVGTLQSCDVALPIVHGPRGEDGTLAALLELAGVPYVGSGVRPGALAMDKWVTKLIASELGIATAPGRLLTARTAAGCAWNGPVVVKPVAAGSSLGVTLVREEAAFAEALAEALRHDDRVLVEEVVAGREVDIAVLGDVVTPALEIVADGFFDYEAKYGGGTVFRVPAPIDPAATKALEEAARALYDALGCRGVARVDFFLTEAGPVLNEVNTMPGLTGHSQVPRMFAAAGWDYPQLLDRLIRDALA